MKILLPKILLMVVIFLLPILTEGVCGMILSPELKARQDVTITFGSAPAPSQSPVLILNDFLNPLDTCTRQRVTWLYVGPSLSLSLAVTNIGVTQTGPPPPTPSRSIPISSDTHARVVPSGASGGVINAEIIEEADPLASAVPWSVNVPEGWYQIVATVGTTFVGQSRRFYVQTGSDTSCLLSITSSSTSPTSTQLPGASTPASSILSTQREGLTPTLSASNPQHSTPGIHNTAPGIHNTGPIVGAVVGTTTTIALLIVYYCWRRRRSTRYQVISGQGIQERQSRGAVWVLDPFDEPGSPGPLDLPHQELLQLGSHPLQVQSLPLKLQRNRSQTPTRRASVASSISGTGVSGVGPPVSERSSDINSTLPEYYSVSSVPPEYSSSHRSHSP